MSPEWIAQASADGGDVQRLLTDVLPWMASLVAALAVLAGGWRYYRRRIRRGEDAASQPWTLQDLREMHLGGALSDQEYERLKARLVMSLRSTAQEGGEGSAGPQGPDDGPEMNPRASL